MGFNLEKLRGFELSSFTVSWWLMALSSLLLLGAYLFSAGLWGLMVREIGGHEVGFLASLRVFFTANLGRYLPGKLWQIAGLAYLARGEGVPAGTATGAAVLGQAFSLAGATLVGAGVLLGMGGAGLGAGGAWAASVLLVVLLAATIPGILKGLMRLWFRLARQAAPAGFKPDPRLRHTLDGALCHRLGPPGPGLLDPGPGLGVPAYPAGGCARPFRQLTLQGTWHFSPRRGSESGRGCWWYSSAPSWEVALPSSPWWPDSGPRLWNLIPAFILAGGYLKQGEGKEEPGVAEGTVLVVIPTYNERDNLPKVVPLVLAAHPEVEVLIVDDNSPDGTGLLAARMARDDSRVHALHRGGKGGLGAAYIDGFRWGLERHYQLFFEMDADLSHPADKIRTMIELSRNHPVVVGSRYVGRRVNVVNWPLTRLIISVFGSIYARIVTRVPVMDATGGFNCWRREVLEAVDLDRIESNGYAFQMELKLRAWRKGFQPLEIPIVFTERETGDSKMSKKIVLEAVWKLWKLRLLDLFGRL